MSHGDFSATARVIVILEHRFFQTPEGAVWTDGPFPNSFFGRYLDVFDEAVVAARARQVAEPAPDWRRSDGLGVRFEPTPTYVGAWQHLLRRRAVARSLAATLDAAPDAAVILRIPSEVASLAAAKLLREGRPFAVEVVGDPHDAWSPGGSRHVLRPYVRWRQARDLRRLCRAGSASAYVTEAALQRRYPPAKGTPSTHYSSVELPDEAFAAEPRREFGAPLRLIHVGSLEHLYKGQDVLLEAVALCRERGVRVQVRMIGDGRYRALLEGRRAELGLEDLVSLPGGLPAGPEVRAELDASDLFVLPSRQEGLPRGLLEAMARGLPAISTPVGGIPEVLPESDLVAAGDVNALARRITDFAGSLERLQAAAARNLERAQDFHDSELQGRRNRLFRDLATLSDWAPRPDAGARRIDPSRRRARELAKEEL